MNRNKSFKIETEMLCILDLLTNKEAGQLIKAIFNYNFKEEGEFDYKELTQPVLLAFIPFRNKFIDDEKHSRKGKYHWNWKGGISDENAILRNSLEYKQWRTSVFLRDSYICQHCEYTGENLNAHHIKPWAKYPDDRFIKDNGITLCKQCHIDEHKRMRAEIHE